MAKSRPNLELTLLSEIGATMGAPQEETFATASLQVSLILR